MSDGVSKNQVKPLSWGDSIRQSFKAIDRENLSKGLKVFSTGSELGLALFKCFPNFDYRGFDIKTKQFKDLCNTGRGYLNIFAITNQLIFKGKKNDEGQLFKSWKEQAIQISITVVNIFEVANFGDKMFVHYFDQAGRKILDMSLLACVIKISYTVKGVFSIWIGVFEIKKAQRNTSDLKKQLDFWLENGNDLDFDQAKEEFLDKLNEVLPHDCQDEVVKYREFLNTDSGHQFLKEHKIQTYVIEVEELEKKRDREAIVIASEVQKIAWTAFSIISAMFGSYFTVLLYPSVKVFFALVKFTGNFCDLKQGIDVQIVKAAMRG